MYTFTMCEYFLYSLRPPLLAATIIGSMRGR